MEFKYYEGGEEGKDTKVPEEEKKAIELGEDDDVMGMFM